MERDNRDYTGYTPVGLIPGIVICGLGVLFLLNNLNIVHIYDWWRLWPVILIVIGLQKLVDSSRPNDRAGGIVMLTVGGVFLANNLGWLTRDVWEWWPLLLIAAGLAMLVNRSGHGFPSGMKVGVRQRSSADVLAIFGGFKRQVSTDDYRGASYVAVFGGGEIDLRRAQIQHDAAIVEIQAIFGGFEMKVPTNWLVTIEAVGIFGGTADETLHPESDAPGVKRLIIRGIAIFGGVGIKN